MKCIEDDQVQYSVNDRPLSVVLTVQIHPHGRSTSDLPFLTEIPPRYSLYRKDHCNFDRLLVIFLKMSERQNLRELTCYSWLFEIIFSPSLQSYWISS